MAVQVKARDLEEENGAEVARIECGIRVNRVRVRPRAHDGSEMFVVGVQSRGRNGA